MTATEKAEAILARVQGWSNPPDWLVADLNELLLLIAAGGGADTTRVMALCALTLGLDPKVDLQAAIDKADEIYAAVVARTATT